MAALITSPPFSSTLEDLAFMQSAASKSSPCSPDEVVNVLAAINPALTNSLRVFSQHKRLSFKIHENPGITQTHDGVPCFLLSYLFDIIAGEQVVGYYRVAIQHGKSYEQSSMSCQLILYDYPKQIHGQGQF